MILNDLRRLTMNVIVLCCIILTVSSSTTPTKPSIEVESLVIKFRQALEGIRDEELLVPAINNMYETYKYNTIAEDPRKKLDTLEENIKFTINTIFDAMQKAEGSLKLYNGTNIRKNGQTVVVPCKGSKQDDFVLEDLTRLKNESMSTNAVLHQLSYDLWSLKSLLKQVYLLSSIDINRLEHTVTYSQCSEIDHSILWTNYMRHNKYFTRRVILLLDHGASMDKTRLYLTKLAAKQMIDVLSPNDKFSVIGISSNWSSLYVNETCGNKYLPTILPATENNKVLTNTFIDSLMSEPGPTNYNLGFKTALKIARLFNSGADPVMLLYVSGGQVLSLEDATDLLNSITNNNLTCPFVVNTCAVTSDGMPATEGMRMLPEMLNDYYMQGSEEKSMLVIKGQMINLDRVEQVGLTVARYYNAFNKQAYDVQKKISLPTWDSIAEDTTVSLTLGFFIANQFVILGVDIFFSNFVKDIIQYSNYQKYTYAFLTDLKGNALVHPYMPLLGIDKQMSFVKISKYLQIGDEDLFLKQDQGTYRNKTDSLMYLWKQLDKFYIIGLVIDEKVKTPEVPSKTNWSNGLTNNQLLSYLLSLGDSTTLCKHLGQVATLDTFSLYVSNTHKSSNATIGTQLLPYLRREGQLIKDENAHERLRDELSAIVDISDHLRSRHMSDKNSDYVVRRYVATRSGILQVFPGVAVSHGYEPRQRPWFLGADALPGKLVMGPPYLDSGGAGYIVTASYATPHLVLAVDVTLGYVMKLLLEQMPHCRSSSGNFTCFLVDHRGYLVSHPNLISLDDQDRQPVEQLHLIHKESMVANDLLNHNAFVKKLACNDYTNANIERYYELNMSYDGVLATVVAGEPCVSYWVAPLNGTNLFVGVVNATCALKPTFCPCSVVDRVCLNCQRMEQRECECPCECPVGRSSCTNYTTHDDYSLCTTPTPSPDPVFVGDVPDDASECFPISCENRASLIDCLGVVGCEWCKQDAAGYALNTPFCSSINACFNGVLGALSPYRGFTPSDNSMSSAQGTGVVLGIVIGLGLILSLTFVCWRSYSASTRTQQVYVSARQEEQLHMSELHNGEEFVEQGNHSDKLLLDDKSTGGAAPPVSPYCVNTNYARPATAADSDHGYSTMTPHDESEHLSLAPVEIDSMEDDVASDDTNPSMRHKTSLLTRLPNKNSIIVPVTVHRNVDAT